VLLALSSLSSSTSSSYASEILQDTTTAHKMYLSSVVLVAAGLTAAMPAETPVSEPEKGISEVRPSEVAEAALPYILGQMEVAEIAKELRVAEAIDVASRLAADAAWGADIDAPGAVIAERDSETQPPSKGQGTTADGTDQALGRWINKYMFPGPDDDSSVHTAKNLGWKVSPRSLCRGEHSLTDISPRHSSMNSTTISSILPHSAASILSTSSVPPSSPG